MKGKVLITGAAGFIGTHVTNMAHDMGLDIVLLDSLFVGDTNLAHHSEKFPLYKVDLRNALAVDMAVSEIKPTIVIHLAALHFIPYCNQHPLEAVEANLIGTKNLLAALEKHRPEKVVAASSAAVYPIADAPHKETDTMGSTDIYGHTKMLGEDLLELFSKRTGVSSASCRFFNVYGPYETQPHLIPVIVEQLAGGASSIQLGNLGPARDYIHGQDIASGVLSLAEHFDAPYGAFNIGTGKEWTVKEVVDMCSDILKRDITITQDPKRMRPSDRMHLCADNSLLQKTTGWSPKISFKEGLADLLERELSA
jgi:UDP-glucose 4-epimerase